MNRGQRLPTCTKMTGDYTNTGEMHQYHIQTFAITIEIPKKFLHIVYGFRYVPVFDPGNLWQISSKLLGSSLYTKKRSHGLQIVVSGNLCHCFFCFPTIANFRVQFYDRIGFSTCGGFVSLETCIPIPEINCTLPPAYIGKTGLIHVRGAQLFPGKTYYSLNAEFKDG